jgi:tetratricopeptide (TPR) repeat protein
MPDPRRELALELFRDAYELQMQGELELAIDFYRRSIEIYPTAEAYTFLGWTYRFHGRLEEAIEECRKAILVDPSLGNPYNDIGAYLIELGRHDEAIPWLEKAIASPRYEAYHYPWYNLGRVYVDKEIFSKAQDCFRKAIEIEPDYQPAAAALSRIQTLIQ